MKIPTHWSRATFCDYDDHGSKKCFAATAYSYESLEDAKAKALERAKFICSRVLGFAHLDRYEYGSTPLREPVVEEIRYGNHIAAVITRNRYGALVLNSNSVLFVDIDCTDSPSGSRGFWSSLFFGIGASAKQATMEKSVSEHIAKIDAWVAIRPAHSLRVYRTAAGLRLIFTDRLYEPQSTSVSAIFSELGADPLYAKLTRAQECFRARLTPKPWRVGYSPLNQVATYPWESRDHEEGVKRWVDGYVGKNSAYKVCHFVKSFGAAPSGIIAHIVDTHDRMTRPDDPLPMA